MKLKTVKSERLQKLLVDALEEEHTIEKRRPPVQKETRLARASRIVIVAYITLMLLGALIWGLYDLIWHGDLSIFGNRDKYHMDSFEYEIGNFER